MKQFLALNSWITILHVDGCKCQKLTSSSLWWEQWWQVFALMVPLSNSKNTSHLNDSFGKMGKCIRVEISNEWDYLKVRTEHWNSLSSGGDQRLKKFLRPVFLWWLHHVNSSKCGEWNDWVMSATLTFTYNTLLACQTKKGAEAK